MGRDTFIITMYGLGIEYYQLVKENYPIGCGGLDRDLFAYFHHHYQHFFPALKDRPTFVRQAANLWQVKVAIWRLIVQRSGQAQSSVQVIDTLPLPVCAYTRARRDRGFIA